MIIHNSVGRCPPRLCRDVWNVPFVYCAWAIRTGLFFKLLHFLHSSLETLLVKAATREKYDAELAFVTNFLKDDFNQEQLCMQLGNLASNIPCEATQNFDAVITYLRELSQAQKSFLSEVCTLASLILVMSATNAVSERSFSALRRLKTYLRSIQ